MNPKLQDRITVRKDGEEIYVYNLVNIEQPAEVRGESEVRRHKAGIGAGDSFVPPEYVTEWVAQTLYDEFGIKVEDRDITAVDIESEDVTVL